MNQQTRRDKLTRFIRLTDARGDRRRALFNVVPIEWAGLKDVEWEFPLSGDRLGMEEDVEVDRSYVGLIGSYGRAVFVPYTSKFSYPPPRPLLASLQLRVPEYHSG